MTAQTFVSPTAEVEVDGRKLTIAPLNLFQIQQVRAIQDKIDSITWVEYLAETSKIVHQTIQGAYKPSLEEFMAMLTVDSWRFMLDQVMKLSGMASAKQGEVKPEISGQNSTAQS